MRKEYAERGLLEDYACRDACEVPRTFLVEVFLEHSAGAVQGARGGGPGAGAEGRDVDEKLIKARCGLFSVRRSLST